MPRIVGVATLEDLSGDRELYEIRYSDGSSVREEMQSEEMDDIRRADPAITFEAMFSDGRGGYLTQAQWDEANPRAIKTR